MRWSFSLVAIITALSAQQIAPEILLLSRIKQKMRENLERLPNYTCLQTIERSVRSSGSKRYHPLDTVRIEVALLDGKELFAWPGEQKFQERDISEIAPGGAIGNGNFALHAKSVFLTNAPTFKYLGREIRNERELVSYSYQVPQFRSGFRLRVGPQEAIVAYHGIVWADAKTLDLVRMEVKIDEIPPILELATAGDIMEYRRLSMGSSDFLLPSTSELLMIDTKGGVNRNRVSFSSCRQYAGESILSFGEPPPEQAEKPPPPARPINLPPGLRMELQLKTPIAFGQSAVGDEITAALSGNVKKRGQVLLPKGSLLTGRIVRLERSTSDNYFVGIEFSRADIGTRSAVLCGQVEKMGSVAPPQRPNPTRTLAVAPDGKSFLIQSPQSSMLLPKGYMILVRTMQCNSGEEEKP